MARLLRWLTGDSLANDIAGDLAEQRQRRGALWFWRSSLSIAIYLIAFRIRSMRRPIMRNVSGDIRDAVRLFRRSPFFGAGAVLMLALGTGATAAILSLADATLLRPLPIPQVDRVVQSTFSFSYLDFRDLVSEHHGFSQIAAWGYPPLAIEQGGDAVQINGAAVSGDYFALMGQQPLAGRVLNRGDDVAGAPAAAVVSERLWTRMFQRDPHLVGSVITINRQPVTVVGISRAVFRGSSLLIAPELFVNLTSLPALSTGFMANPDTLRDRERVFLSIAGRLSDGVSVEQADGEARRIYYAHRTAPPQRQNAGAWFAPMLTSALGGKTAGDLRQFITILLGASVVTILLTCATVANLLLVRSERRRHELAVRAALGAGRARLCRLLLVESLGIGFAGGLTGVGIAALVLNLFGTFTLPGQIAIRDLQLTVNIGMLASCAAIGVATALVFGLAPIWQTRRVDAGTTLRAGVRTTSRHAVKSTLVGVQIALCVLLLGGSLAFGRAIAHALALDLGFNVTDTSISGIDPSLTRLSTERASALRQQALDALRARPEVRAAGWALRRPMSGGFVVNPVIEGRADDAKPLDLQANVVTDGYFDAMRIPVVAGRAFTTEDERSRDRVAIVSASLARSLWPDGTALGHRVSMENPRSPDMKWASVVGIVGDIHRVIGGPAVPMLYLASGQTPQGFEPNYLVVRSSVDPSIALTDVRTVLRGIEPHVVITLSQAMTEHVEAPLMAHRLGLMLFLMFATLAVALTGFGLYAVVATAVAQRTREIGIRVALGAEAVGVVAMVLRQGVWPIVTGLAVGIIGLAMSARLIEGFMFSLPAVSPATIVTICAAIAVVASVAMLVPARRALSVDPTTILRAD